MSVTFFLILCMAAEGFLMYVLFNLLRESREDGVPAGGVTIVLDSKVHARRANNVIAFTDMGRVAPVAASKPRASARMGKGN